MMNTFKIQCSNIPKSRESDFSCNDGWDTNYESLF